MKIEVVENHKIKVTLSTDDLIYYNIKPESLSPNSPQLNKFLFHIMENVKKETDFNPYRGQIVVEAVASKSGVTLYITKLKSIKSNAKVAKQLIKNKKYRAVTNKKTISKNSYVFKDFDNLCSSLTFLDDHALDESTLYKYNKKWYFLLGNCSGIDESHCILCEFCDDFGGMLHTEAFLDEHGEKIASSDKLLDMVNGIRKLKEV